MITLYLMLKITSFIIKMCLWLFFIAPEANPSEFLLELKQHYKNVKLLGEWNEEPPVSIAKKPCPVCGYPMQLKYKKAYGLKLYICTNEPEICGFMTNNYQGGKLAIQKCDKCRDGYLIVKPGRETGFFLGCTNYNKNGTGCDRRLSKQAYYAQMGYQMEEQEPLSTFASESRSATKEKEQDRQVVESSKQVSVTAEVLKEQKWNAQGDDYVEVLKAEVPPVEFHNVDLNDVVFIVVKALQNISQIRFYGFTMLCDVLHGEDNKRIRDNQLHMIPEYGAFRRFPAETVRAVIEWMISEHYILQTKAQYPVLHSTYEGLHYSESITEGKLKKLRKYLEKDD